MKAAIVLICSFLLITSSLAQDFTSPVKHDIKLAGTFGELRSNHFHMGIDIKSSRGKYPDAILSADVGFISRIKVSRSGYGNAIYIDHPSGYTTVYGHLKTFSEFIDTFVNNVQLDSQSFEIDFYPDSLQIPVSKGQEIGKMGNSGSSYGPHLHFEVRNTKSEAPLNPMRFGIKPVDITPPIIKQVKFYHLDDKHHEISSEARTPGISGTGKYTLAPIKLGTWRTGIAIQAYDPMNNNYNKNGIYKIEMFVDGVKTYSVAFDSISFDDTRYINAHIDYAHFKETKTRLHRLFRLPGNNLPNLYAEKAIIKLYEDVPQEILLVVYDFNNNASELTFTLQRSTEMKVAMPRVFNYYLPYTQANVIEQNELKIYFPAYALYENLYLYLSHSESEYLSEVYHIGNKKLPLHQPLRVFIDGSHIPVAKRGKVCLIECSKSDHISTYGGKWQGNFFVTEVFSFGNYALALDTLPPEITFLQDGNDFTNKSTLSFKIADNYSDSGGAKGLEYQATIDENWAKFSYDLKKNRIQHVFEMPVTHTTHTLLLTVTDDRGNQQQIEKKFFR